MTPAEFRIRDIALIAIWCAEVLPDLGEAVEFVFRDVFGQPIAAVV
jgi:hypothetical protein